MGSYGGRTNGEDTCVGGRGWDGSGLDEAGDEGADEFETAGGDGAGEGELMDHYPRNEKSVGRSNGQLTLFCRAGLNGH